MPYGINFKNGSSALTKTVNITDDDANRYENLLNTLNDEEVPDDIEACVRKTKQEKQKKSDHVRYLAEIYGNFLGKDLNSDVGKSWLESTVKLYSSSDSLYERFINLTAMAEELAKRNEKAA